MKKLLLIVVSCACVGLSRADDNGNLSQALHRLVTRLTDLSDDLGKPPVPPRDDAGLHIDTHTTPPPVPGQRRPLPAGPIMSVDEKKQLKSVLSDLDLGEDFQEEPEEKDTSVDDYLHDLNKDIGLILKGFDPKTREYIGYVNYKKEFLARHLKDYDTAVKLFKATTQKYNLNQYAQFIQQYEAWRPFIAAAVGKLPKDANQ